MTDTELLDGLQRLFDRPEVVVLRTCRSGVKLELARSEIVFADESLAIADHREYFGSGAEWPEGQVYEKLGPNIRTAIERAIVGEGV